MVKVAGKRLCVVRTSEGVFALDNACPHEGYGLVQGDLKEGELTCAWHNWKFRVADGRCLLGEEDVRSYPIRIEGRTAVADLTDPDPASLRPQLLDSLRRAIENNYVGQTARDVVRLLRADANPGELIWEAVAYGAPRAEFGWGHAIASATDCLAMTARFDGDARALPIVQAIAGVSEVERRRPLRPQPAPMTALPGDAEGTFRKLVEDERLDEAEALVLGAIERGWGRDELLALVVGAVTDHHLGYGHMAIYTQKAFQLLDVLGWDRAGTVLPHLVPTIVYGTREDKLPYMRPFMRALAEVDLDELASRPADPAWRDDGDLRAALLGRDKRAPVTAAVAAVRDGAGIDGLLDTVALAVSERLLRYDPNVDFDLHDDFGWLDITHGLTYANASRWAWRERPGADTARLALFAAFLAHYTGRNEWRRDRALPSDPSDPSDRIEPRTGDLRAAVEDRRSDDAVAFALGLPAESACAQLEHAALADRAGSFIVNAHFVKTSHAAVAEAATTGSSLPLAATARFVAAPKLERFVAEAVTRSIDFLSGRGPAAAEED
jgi:nitrite reductase/ring-hydroxylating ferredoxin subunit